MIDGAPLPSKMISGLLPVGEHRDRMFPPVVSDALTLAIWRRGKPDALLHYSDQGSR